LYRRIWLKRIVAASIAAVVVQVAAMGQAPAQPDRPNVNRTPAWNPELMMDIYVKALTRQYNLSPDQEEYTRKLLTKRVKDFLQDHETDLRTLMFEMLEFQQKRQLPPADVARQWAEMGKPIFKDARKAILDGNKEWHEILNDAQRKRHDSDMAMLERQFKQMEERLNDWGNGEIKPEHFYPVGSRGPGVTDSQAWTTAKPEDTWEMYLRMFVIRYALDASQKETAQSVLRECRDRADAYREKHKAEFDDITAKMKELRESHAKENVTKESLDAARKAHDQLREKKTELEKPISEGIFNEFKQRLDQIPTKEQKAAYEQKRRPGKKDESAETKPAATPTTNPSK
jgi:hypothetical protein